MRALHDRPLLPAIALLLTLNGCTPPLTPTDVADRFWRAALTQQPAKMRRYVRAVDQTLINGDTDILPLSEFELGRTITDAGSATIKTSVVLAAEPPVTLHIDTLLVREGDNWRVNYAATVNAISQHSQLAQVIEQIERLGDSLKQDIDQSVDELKRALPAIQAELSRIESDIKQRVPELRKRLEAFSRRLEESLRSPPPPAPPPPPEGAIAT